MNFEITAIYAVALGVVGIVLSTMVSIHRGKQGISLGDGESADMLVKIRRFGNYAENVPLALILIGLAEAGGASATWLHLSGGVLLVSRLIHPFGLHIDKPATVARIAGSMGSKVAMIIPITALSGQILAG